MSPVFKPWTSDLGRLGIVAIPLEKDEKKPIYWDMRKADSGLFGLQFQ